ncbi:conserved protein of unknown function (plasmid) [Rhodovastum atsumiense]|uniref:Uncharacterized protein n=1 Tax=Rhodovastum atsumiense TaxID=504468 RepID=A0A5M6IUB5_9PROT|nr:hypothetical protein [Rhodovastum atsumiense]KAA5611874.1 hypothetical protein F1189_12640 [Rhodovastum atsumiense]CAH2606147.1 conserved protein of unknown function [Rhodovastum atsumiense]
MSGTLYEEIQSAIWQGLGAAADVLGEGYSLFRPHGVANPVAPGSQIDTVNVRFDAKPAYAFSAPNLYGKAIWYLLGDASGMAVGDYLVGSQGTFFLVAKQPLESPVVVECNAVVSVVRPAKERRPGLQSNYMTDAKADEQLLMTSWPCSLLLGSKGERPASGIQGETRQPWYVVLLPAPDGVDLVTNDLLVDAAGRRLTISAVELTDLGYRLTAEQSAA